MDPRETGRSYSASQARLRAIRHAFNNLGMRTDTISPDDQAPDWIKEGIAEMEDGNRPSRSTLRRSDRQGGKSEPDPWFT